MLRKQRSYKLNQVRIFYGANVYMHWGLYYVRIKLCYIRVRLRYFDSMIKTSQQIFRCKFSVILQISSVRLRSLFCFSLNILYFNRVEKSNS